MFVTIRDTYGEEHVVEFSPGDNLLSVILKNSININTFCDGNGLCGKCHVYVDNHDVLDAIDDIEELGLDKAHGVKINSRLACRITLTEKCDGLVISIVK